MNLNFIKDKLFQKYGDMFDGTLGKYTGSNYTIELKEDVKPFPILKIHKLTLKKEVDRLVKIGVLKKVNNFQWVASSFIIPKTNGTVKFISDFRELNKTKKGNLFQFLNIPHLLIKLEGFRYATCLEPTMGYYHTTLCPLSWILCTIVLL